jgi:hypothetical protein
MRRAAMTVASLVVAGLGLTAAGAALVPGLPGSPLGRWGGSCLERRAIVGKIAPR